MTQHATTTITTTIFTRHEIRPADSDINATLMLDDSGDGTVIVATSAGPAFSFDASQLWLFTELFQEADRVRRSLCEPVPTDATRLRTDD